MSGEIKILILEDNVNDIALLIRELGKLGVPFVPDVVQTREKFIFSLNNFFPDIIISDYSLPQFDGVAAFDIKQKISPDVPFIIVSGIVGDEKAVEMIKRGITDYVIKDKLFTLNLKIARALRETQDVLAKRMADAKLKMQNEKLLEIAMMQSHQVRGPLANILGLYNLFKFDDPSHPINIEVIKKLKHSLESLDLVIHEITRKTSEIEPFN